MKTKDYINKKVDLDKLLLSSTRVYKFDDYDHPYYKIWIDCDGCNFLVNYEMWVSFYVGIHLDENNKIIKIERIKEDSFVDGPVTRFPYETECLMESTLQNFL